MKTARKTISEKLQGTETLAAFEAGGKDKFRQYFNYGQYASESQRQNFFNRLGCPTDQDLTATHNAYCVWGTNAD